jgi:hypothetical protein
MGRALAKLCLMSLFRLLLGLVEGHAVLDVPVAANIFDGTIFVTLLIHRAHHDLVVKGLGYALLTEGVATVQYQRLPCLVIIGF